MVAAGSGVRMGAGVPKAFLSLGGRPLLDWCLDVLRGSPRIAGIVIVGPPGRPDEAGRGNAQATPPVLVVPGGPSRAASVALGLDAVPAGAGRVLVHDAARPLLTGRLVEMVLDGIGTGDGAIAAAPLADTPKRVDGDGVIVDGPGREGLWLAQTPQAFTAAALRAAVRRAREDGTLDAATDCSALVCAAGGRVRVVRWDEPNLKVTRPADLRVAERLLGDDAGPGVG